MDPEVADNDSGVNTKIVLNIGGVKFVTFPSTLRRLQGTRLSSLGQSDPTYDSDANEFFFDRNPRLFPYILDIFREGELHFPRCICAPTVRSELDFWGITEDRISSCCWKTCSDWEEEQQTLAAITKAFTGPAALHTDHPGEKDNSWADKTRRIKIATWYFLEDPHSSKWAKVWANVYLVFLFISTFVSCLGSHPDFRVPATYRQNTTFSDSWNTSNPKIRMYQLTEEHPVLRITHIMCSFLFFIELLLRFSVCPCKAKFFISFFNLIDILAVLPMFTFCVLHLIIPNFWMYLDLTLAYYLVGLTTIFRSVRIMKMVKHNRGLQILCLALKASGRELILLILLVAIGMLIFSTMIYLVELSDPYTFPSIPTGFWWSIITMTTVGYGDVVPVTSFGCIVGVMCAISGMLITGLPIPVIASNFHLYYTYAKLKAKMEQRKEARTPTLSHALMPSEALSSGQNQINEERSRKKLY